MKNAFAFFLMLLLSNEVTASEECSKKNTPREATKCVEAKISRLTSLVSQQRDLIDDLLKQQESIPSLQKRVNDLSDGISNIGSLPDDVVLAIANASCPIGWKVYEDTSGRVIVGSGLGKNLSPRVFKQRGGSEIHKLSLDEIPKHRHSHTDDGVAYKPSNRYEGLRTEFKGDSSVGLHHGSRSTGYVGGNKAHNNMPPFFVLTFCIRG